MPHTRFNSRAWPPESQYGKRIRGLDVTTKSFGPQSLRVLARAEIAQPCLRRLSYNALLGGRANDPSEIDRRGKLRL